MINKYGAVDGMKIGRRNRSTRTVPAPKPLYPQQILPDLQSNRGGKPAANLLSYRTAAVVIITTTTLSE
jgi:hypothetical protein